MIFRLYCYTIFAALILTVVKTVTGFPLSEVLLLSGLGLIASASPLKLRDAHVTLLLPVILPAVTSLNLGWVGIVVAIGSIPASQLKWPFHYFLQARAVLSLSAIAGGIAYHLVTSTFDFSLRSYLGLLVAYMAYELVNAALFIVTYSLKSKRPPDNIIGQVINVYSNSSLPFAIAVLTTSVYHYDKTHIAFIALILLFAVNRDKFRALLINEQLYPQIIQAMMKVIENTDSYTKGHSLRVAYYSELIGRQMRLKSWEVERLKLVSTLHDLGKQSVPGDIIRKKERLTDDEMTIIRRHCDAGEEILKDISLFKGEDLRAIREHHEWVNGQGYPNGLKGEEICLWARIIAVADAFDAMTSERPYRTTWQVGQALLELKRCSGTQFDGVIVGYLCQALEGVSPDDYMASLLPTGVA